MFLQGNLFSSDVERNKRRSSQSCRDSPHVAASKYSVKGENLSVKQQKRVLRGQVIILAAVTLETDHMRCVIMAWRLDDGQSGDGWWLEICKTKKQESDPTAVAMATSYPPSTFMLRLVGAVNRKSPQSGWIMGPEARCMMVTCRRLDVKQIQEMWVPGGVRGSD